MEQLYLIGATLLCLLIIILLSKSHKTTSDKLLLAILFLVLPYLLTIFYFKGELNWAMELCSALVFVYGPLLYQYAQSQLIEGFTLKRKDLVHYLPFLLYLILVAPFLMQGNIAPLPAWTREAITFLKLISLFVYVFLVLKSLRVYSKKVVKKDSVSWIRKLIGGVLFLAFLGLLSQLLVKFRLTPASQEDFLINIVLSIGLVILAFYGLRYTSVFIPVQFPSLAKKYSKSGLKNEDYSKYIKSLQNHIQKNKPYKNPDLTLTELAGKIYLPANHLSQLLNDSLSTNFADFINSYRIKEVVAQLHQQEHKKFTLLTLAFNAGFNSKASFNRAFQKVTGQTPSAYIKKHRL